MKKLLLILFFSSTSLSALIAQNDPRPNGQIVSPVIGSQTTGASTANSYQAVDLFTGKAAISVPIYAKVYGTVNVNIGLNYSSNGITVLDFPSPAGSGWNLSHGFSLTRTVNGNADDEYDYGDLYRMDTIGTSQKPSDCKGRVRGFLRDGGPVPLSSTTPGNDVKNFYLSNQDSELDVFTVTLSGKSEKFVIGKNLQLFPLGNCNWKIEYGYNSNADFYHPGSYIDRFTVTDENGNKYFFRAITHSLSSTFTSCPSEEACAIFSNAMVSGDRDPIDNWEIEKITTYNGMDIVFNYSNKFPSYNVLRKEAHYVYEPSVRAVKLPSNQYAYRFRNADLRLTKYECVYRARLENIIFPDGASVSFIYNPNNRLDAANDPAMSSYSNPFSEIRLNRYGNPVTFYKFHHSYFYAASPGYKPYTNNGQPAWGNNHALRLKLDSITVTPVNSNQAYYFEYDYDNILPSRSSFSIDHWGYYTGIYNQGLLQIDPELGPVVIPGGGTLPPYEGQRNASSSAVKSNMLKKITFADKSSVEYEFEANKGRFYDFTNGLDANETLGGGSRIKTIKLFDGISHNNDIIRKYDYTAENGLSSGILFLKPKYTRDFYSIFHAYVRISVTNSLVGNYGYTYNGSPIGYSKVTVTYGANGEGGKEVNLFSNLIDGSEVNIISGANPNVPYTNRQYLKDWKMGLLKNKKTYSSTGGLVKEEANEYSASEQLPSAGVLPYYKSVKYELTRGVPEGITNNNCSEPYGWEYALSEYYPTQGYSNLSKKITKLYLDNGTSSTTQMFTYDSRGQLSKISGERSDGKTVESRFYRAYDFTPNSANIGIQNLISGNRQNEIVRQDVLLRDNPTSAASYIESTILTYKNVFIDIPNSIYRVEPGKIFKLKVQNPIAEATVPAYNPNSIFPVNAEGFYYEDQALYYNDAALPTGTNKLGISNSNLFDGYNVIAEAKNAKETDLAYSSFESNNDAQGGWLLETVDIDKTKGYSGNCSTKPTRNPILLQKPLDNMITYRISMWVLSGTPIVNFNTGSPLTLISTGETNAQGWTLYTGTFSGKTTCYIPAGCQIDELRLAPAGASLKTYTYQPISGKLSECDERNNVTNYVYDFFSRPIEMVNRDRNIIKQFRYGIGVQN